MGKHVTGEHEGECAVICRNLLDGSEDNLDQVTELVLSNCGQPVLEVGESRIDRDHTAAESLGHDETVVAVPPTDIEHPVMRSKSERIECVEDGGTRARIQTAVDGRDRCFPVPVAVHLLHGHRVGPLPISHVKDASDTTGHSEIRAKTARPKISTGRLSAARSPSRVR